MKTTLKKNKEGYGYKYTELAEIHNYLEANGMKYYQEIQTCEMNCQDYIYTWRYIDGKWEDKPIRGCRVTDATLTGVKNPAQEQGSALTYARRYSLLMAFGLATEDDDAQALSKPIEITLDYAKDFKINFGTHKGKKLSDIPQSYLDWLIGSPKCDATIKKCIELLNEDKGIKTLTEEEQKERLNLMGTLSTLCITQNIDREKIYTHYKVSSDTEMTIEQLKDAVKKLEDKK